MSRLLLPTGCLAALLLTGAPAPAAAAEPATPVFFTRDFDHDGVEDRLVSRPGADEIQHRPAGSGAWEREEYGLPEGVVRFDENGADAGLRFVDLNRDGFDDVLFSNPRRVAVHLWTKDVKPHLGWTKGWSQFVRAGERTGAANEPPSLVGAEVRVDGGELVARWPAMGGTPGREWRGSVKALIAFDMPPPLSPDEALRAFRVAPGFRVELVAAEPEVIDPVAFDWGPDGRLWVVEMRDYPLGVDGKGKPGGFVKRLEDVDGDGRCERATVFLEGIAFPSSIMAWGKGLLVAAAPHIFYAEDTDGDGRADVRRELFDGFVEGNQQHRVNGFTWGLDGWVYAANGDSGGTVKSVATGRSVSISGRDLRFRPDTGELETVSAQTQYARNRDDWGHWFGNNNPTWLWQVVVPEHYLRRNPGLAVKRVSRVLANYDDSTRVFPASRAMVRPNQPWSLNHVTSACSASPYRDDLFGPDFATSVFIGEPVHNAVHREVLYRDGTVFGSRRAPGEERSEFLASTDNWFRPVTVKTGPDGALYVADMYRFVIEHPEWISPEMQARLDLRAGTDKGRLYRVVPEGRARRPIPNLAALHGRNLAVAMDSPNGWQRDTVQQLLVAAADPAAAAPLAELLTPSHAPVVRAQALATLGLLKALPVDRLPATLRDPHPGVRIEALRQAEAFTSAPGAGDGDDPVFLAVAALAADGDPEVRLQAAFSLGAWPAAKAEPVLRRLAAREDVDEWQKIAIQSSLAPGSELFAALVSRTPIPKPPPLEGLKPSSDDRPAVIASYAGVDRLPADAERGHRQYQNLCATCHRLRGEGSEVGPDLGMVGTKETSWLLHAILDPSQAVDARYRAWSVTLKSGDVVDGLVSAETANNVVLRVAGGAEHAVLRSEITSMDALATSLMPGGFETALKPADLADLLRWLRGP